MCADTERDLLFWQGYLAARGAYHPAQRQTADGVIAQSIACAHAARKAVESIAGMPCVPGTLDALLASFQVGVRRIDLPAVPLLGEYDRHRREIVLYPSTIAGYTSVFPPSKADLTRLCLAHEFYHALEHRPLGETKKRVMQRLCSKRLHGGNALRFCSEIAAHTFAAAVFGLHLSDMEGIIG